MTHHVPLDNVDHADLRVAIRHGAAFGDAVNQLLVMPGEFEELQREFPILFRRGGDADAPWYAVVLTGFDQDENLFLADGGWTTRAVPERTWHVLGPVSGQGVTPANLHLHGWVADVGAFVAKAAILVGGGGDGLVALAAAYGKRFLCLPEPRAYGEQTEKAEALHRLGAALVRPSWPAAEAWPGLMREALALDPSIIAGLYDPEGLKGCAAFLDALAGEGGLR